MLNANALRAEIARNGLTQKSVAKSIGITPTTFSKKMKDGSFGLLEANALIRLLDIKDPEAIFFDTE